MQPAGFAISPRAPLKSSSQLGRQPWSGRILRRATSCRWAWVVFLFCVAAAISSPAQTFTTLFSFDGTDGSLPYASLVQGVDGNLYGTTANNHGTVFSITTGGTLTQLYSFCVLANCADGTSPTTGLVLATDGNFYGTTQFGGANCESSTGFGCGTVYKISPEGALTTLYSFCAIAKCKDGQQPSAALIQATDGNFYGTTYEGGVKCPLGGTAFKITPEGKLTTIFSFCRPSSTSSIGTHPLTPLVQGTDGNLYGTTSGGGLHGEGTVFRLTLSGVLTTLYSFCTIKTTRPPNCTDGLRPSGLIQGTDGNFYGTTESGGPVFGRKLGGGGTIFRITPSGTFTTLYTFCSQPNCADGASPLAAPIQASDGNFYGTTPGGGKNACNAPCGTIFKITPQGSLTTLYTFCSAAGCTNDGWPQSGLVQATDGNFYGTTYLATSGQGTVFQLSVGLGPIVEPVPTSGAVGSTVTILGTNLTGATAVSFNGTAATYTVVSATEITATVPVGAASGPISVTTPTGTLSSNMAFQVTP